MFKKAAGAIAPAVPAALSSWRMNSNPWPWVYDGKSKTQRVYQLRHNWDKCVMNLSNFPPFWEMDRVVGGLDLLAFILLPRSYEGCPFIISFSTNLMMIETMEVVIFKKGLRLLEKKKYWGVLSILFYIYFRSSSSWWFLSPSSIWMNPTWQPNLSL